MDDLIVAGAAGIVFLCAAGLLLAYGAITVLLIVIHAFASGEYLFVFQFVAAIILAGLVYLGTGWWLQKTGRI
jgi:hypothetical protein